MKIKTTRTITFSCKLEAVKWLVNYYKNPNTSVGLQKSKNGSEESPHYSCYYLTPDEHADPCSVGGHCAIGAILSYAGVSPEDMAEEGMSNNSNASEVIKHMNIDVEDMPRGAEEDPDDIHNYKFWAIIQQIHDSIAMAGALDGRFLAGVLEHNAELLSSGTWEEREALQVNLRNMLQGRIPKKF
jgi:hypothetical protein